MERRSFLSSLIAALAARFLPKPDTPAPAIVNNPAPSVPLHTSGYLQTYPLPGTNGYTITTSNGTAANQGIWVRYNPNDPNNPPWSYTANDSR